MAGEARYTPDRAGWDALAVGPEMRAVIGDFLSRGKRYAEGISPHSTPATRAYFDRRYGPQPRRSYSASFETETQVVSRRGRPRVEGELRNTSPQAAAVETGNKQNRKPAHVMGRTRSYLEQ